MLQFYTGGRYLRDDVPAAKSSRSTSATDKPRDRASTAMPVPTQPPPMTTRSNVSVLARAIVEGRGAGRHGVALGSKGRVGRSLKEEGMRLYLWQNGYSHAEAFERERRLGFGGGGRTYAMAARPAEPATAATSFFLSDMGSGRRPTQSFSTLQQPHNFKQLVRLLPLRTCCSSAKHAAE